MNAGKHLKELLVIGVDDVLHAVDVVLHGAFH